MLNKNSIVHKWMQRYGRLYLCLLVVATLTSCGGGRRQDVHFNRFEQFLFSQKSDYKPADFRTNLINFNPEDTAYLRALDDFRSDEVVYDIYRITDSLYHDIRWLERDLGGALARLSELCPDIRYDGFYTMVTADIDDYRNRVFCNDHELAVSLDHYAVGNMERYQYFGLPAYIIALSTREHIAADCMAAIAREHIVLPEGQLTMLDYIVAEGKVMWLLEKTLPHTPDSILLRYSSAQLDWMKHNTANVWAWLIENRMIYSTDYALLRNFIDDAPKTNAFGDGSAPRTVAYIGWQIVGRYMKKSGASAAELLEETDSQKILTISGWRTK